MARSQLVHAPRPRRPLSETLTTRLARRFGNAALRAAIDPLRIAAKHRAHWVSPSCRRVVEWLAFERAGAVSAKAARASPVGACTSSQRASCWRAVARLHIYLALNNARLCNGRVTKGRD